ncbi:MAG: urate hydroxylase PuuD [Pseudomonadota bacterium]
MTLDPVVLEWLQFAARWLHVITAIAWIGSSFYFIALDLGLRKTPDLPAGAHGEEWQVHGGGFYHIQKYLVAPERLPEHLTWFKWESYWTWVSGFILLALTYYLGAELYLVDPNKLDIPVWGAVVISIASLVLGWFAYDWICKSPLGRDNVQLMLLLFAILVGLCWVFMQVFSDRAAFLHLGAVVATWMSANVFLLIIPNQKIVVADLKAGRTPNAKYGQIAKQRSTHNNYLTLPVLFFMLSNHYPLSYSTQYSVAIAALVLLMGFTIRHFFNTMHSGGGRPYWTWGATAALFALAVFLSTFPPVTPSEDEADAAAGAPAQTTQVAALMSASDFDAITSIVTSRCAMCHAAEPGWDGMAHPPKGVMLETPEQIAAHARAIYLQSGRSHAMPPANLSYMEPQERRAIIAWYENALR